MLELPFGIKVLDSRPLDSYYYNPLGSPWASVSDVNSGIPSSLRYQGLTVNVNGVEYWYKDGITNGDLVEKITGGSISADEDELLKASNGEAVGTGVFSMADGDLTLGSGLSGATREIYADGTATDVGLVLKSKGAAAIVLEPGFPSGDIFFATPNSVRFGTGTIGGTKRTMSVGGSEANVDFEILTKGTGKILLGADVEVDGILEADDVGITSDRRLKENITKATNQLEKVAKIADLVSTYTVKSTGEQETGFVAQELQEVAPEYVVNGEILSVKYAKMVAPLYAAIAEIKKEIDEIKTLLK